MSSVDEEIFAELERDLTTQPMRISAYHDLPFAMLQYEPQSEFECRSRIRRLAASLEQNHNRRVSFISLGDLVWRAIRETEGIQSLVEEEASFGFDRAQQTVNRLLSDKEFAPIASHILARMAKLDPVTDIVFLVRAGALAPGVYRRAKLLDELHGQTLVPIILFYPGLPDEQGGLRFMGLPHQQSADIYNYRVKIYGGQR